MIIIIVKEKENGKGVSKPKFVFMHILIFQILFMNNQEPHMIPFRNNPFPMSDSIL